MLSKIIIILLSLLLMLVSLSFLGKFPELEIQALLIPNFEKLNFSSITIIIIFATSLILMILGLLFSSIESSSKVRKLLDFLQNGMPDDKLSKLDTTSKSITEYIKGIGGLPISETVEESSTETPEKDEIPANQEVNELKESESVLPQNDIENNEETSSHEEVQEPKASDELLPFESSNEAAVASTYEEDFSPNLPNPNEFDDNEKKTVVATISEIEALKTSKNLSREDDVQDDIKNEGPETYQPSSFSDFTDDEDSSEGAETIIASVPEELLKQIQDNMGEDSDKAFKAVYKKFYDMKIELNESVASLTEEAFVKKLKDTEKKLINTNNCKRVEFTVYNKNGKAALKATPKY